MNKEKLLAHINKDVPGLTHPNTALMIAQSALRYGMQPLTAREADELWLECTKKYKRPGPAELIKAFCELRTGAPVHEECQPCDTAELHLQNKRPVYPADGDA